MNIDELEKLARAANPEEDWWGHGEGPKIEEPGMSGEDREFIAAANPAAILELIEQYKSLRRLVKIANSPLLGTHTVLWQNKAKEALARANGELK